LTPIVAFAVVASDAMNPTSASPGTGCFAWAISISGYRRHERRTMGIEVSGIFGLIVLVLDIWALLNVIQSGASTCSKIVWIVLVLVLPLLGFLGWLIFGPRKSG